MSNIFLKEFYNSVKDDSWPTVDDYIDIKHLPLHIIQELNSLHNFESRKKEITDVNYWAQISCDFCFTNNQDCFFFAVPKCGSTFWRHNLVEINKWRKSSITEIGSNSTAIAVCINPIVRFKKGLAQFFYDIYLNSKLSLEEIDKFIDASLEKLLSPDVHTMPYTLMFRNYLNNPTWIPVDTLDIETTNRIVTNLFNKEKKYEFKHELTDVKIHKSSVNKLQIYQKISDFFDTKPSNTYDIYNLLADDLKFYYNLIDNFRVSDYI